MNFTDNSLSNTFLSDEDIMKVCPYAMKTTPTNPSVSDRYVQATTIDVIHDMRKLGWYPVQAKQCRSKKNSSGIRSFHMIAFQNPDIKVMNDDEIEAYPRIILTNSHDGFASFKFMCGLYRIICSNGLVIATEEFANMSIRHINYNFDELRTLVSETIEKLPNQIDCINKMKKIELKEEDIKDFAVQAIKLRKGFKADDNVTINPDTIADVLTPTRIQDWGCNLWTVYNVIQEKIIKGDFVYGDNKTKKTRKVRGITSITKDINLNTSLFQIANNYAYQYNC